MSTPIATDLVRNAPRSTDDLLRLLFEGLDWPQPRDMRVEEVPLLEWEPEELHLDPNEIARLSSIQQLPRLTATQPFGIFILGFDGGRLPIGAVRRVVDKLVRKQRAKKAQAATLWDLEDLVFFCQAGDDVDVLHVVSFRDTGKRPVMKVISWSTDATNNRIDLVAGTNLPAMTWPDGSVDADAWRRRWISAFTASYRQSIKSAAALAARMADVARDVRDEVLSLYQVETATGPLRQLFTELTESLRADLTPEAFADMYAQTMVYGLLTARISHPEDFEAEALELALTFENPLLDALYSSFRERSDDAFDVDEFGLRDLAELLAEVDVDQILADFGDEDRREDPVVYFYQDFLERYDPAQRRELGTYYTPIPVVRFMVRAVDDVLRKELGLTHGIADDISWRDYAEEHGVEIPTGLTPEEPVVRMIDPATGTGTFLLEWIRHGLAELEGDTEAQYAFLRRIDALEISLSSYAVAHLKVSLGVPPHVRHQFTPGIRLADTLAAGQSQQMGLLGDDPIAAEGERARETKFRTRHSVVIGNPPYLRTSGEGHGTSLGGMVRYDEAGAPGLIRDFTSPLTRLGWGVHAKNLYNLYVYFWRWAVWKACEQHDGPSVTAFITASSFLSGKAFAGMREVMRRRYDEIWVIDLGGEGRGARRDDNVFEGVMTPVTICIAVRTLDPHGSSVPATVRHTKVEGSRVDKLDILGTLSLGEATWREAEGDWHAPFVPRATGEFAEWPLVADLFPWQHSGVQFKRTWPIAPARATLRARWGHLLQLEGTARASALRETGARKVNGEYRGLLTESKLPPLSSAAPGDEPEAIDRYAYRSFDRQWCIVDARLNDRPRPPLWRVWSERQVFMTSLLTGRLGEGPAATATAYVPDLDHFRGSYGAKHVMPLYRDPDGTPNVDPAMLEALRTFLPDLKYERLFAYTYGVLAGTDYATRFLEELETPGPRIPITTDPALFDTMSDLGENLLWLHTFGERWTRDPDRPHGLEVPSDINWEQPVTRLPVDSADYGHDSSADALIVADGRLAGVTAEVWSFSVSGMPVLRKWLDYRTVGGAGRASSSTSVLDTIRPEEWPEVWSTELRELVHVLQATVDYRPAGEKLLEQIVTSPLIPTDDLPEPGSKSRKPPPARRSGARLDLG